MEIKGNGTECPSGALPKTTKTTNTAKTNNTNKTTKNYQI